MSARRAAALLGSLAVAATASAQSPLPEGPGRQQVQTYCTQCHGISTVTRMGRSAEAWRNTVHMMLNVGARLPRDEVGTVVAYLAKHFPEGERPAASMIAGPVKVAIREWVVPTPGERPHDPLLARDGSLWYTGQFANVIGRLDPKTGQFHEYKLKTDHSGPHGLVEDANGHIWFTANFKAYVGELDPATGDVREYPMPDPAARDPHTPIFDASGILWFTVQSGNFVGRLDPKTGEVKLVASPTPRSRPYGIRIDAHGTPWFVEFGANKVARIDPHTLKITEYALPDPASRPRRLAMGPDGAIWYTDYARGFLGRLDPVNGQVREWASPGGREALPYGIAADGAAIWYSESGVEPNTLVRFDPKTHKFQTWIIPSGGGVVRHMVVGPDGRIAMALSGVNRVAIVDRR